MVKTISKVVPAALLAGALLVGGTSFAFAGADDSNTKAFFLPGPGTMNGPGPGSAQSTTDDTERSTDTQRGREEHAVANYRGTLPSASGHRARTHRVRHESRRATEPTRG